MTDLGTVAEQTVAARGVVRSVIARIRALVAGVHRTGHQVVAIGIGTVLTAQRHVTDLGTVAEQTVAAHGVIRRVIATIRGLVARIHRTGY